MPERILRPAELIDLSNQPGYGSIAYKPFKPEEEIRKKVEGKKTFMHLGFYTKNIRTNSFICLFPFFPSHYFFSFLFISFFLSSLIPSLYFIFFFHSVLLSFALCVELCFSFFFGSVTE